ncbi:PREDICTED: uncharacterized protein C19orf47 homolog [Chaetura pelagica]|uniref:uncharacterized protein C19orf47 homolog n=1 Tax=Chaetura pelagica TaxID=8897 RepID=UPI0005234AB2|nr:PREDICTED: uncharacterized protein C19orf47 homolog [Chaetura pelagica]
MLLDLNKELMNELGITVVGDVIAILKHAKVAYRIQKNMLLDLNKELMNELGITVVGDVIAILKHAKVAYRQEMFRAATESLSPPEPRRTAPPAPRRRAPLPASRMIANSLSPSAPPWAPKISVTVSNKLGATKAGNVNSQLPEANPPLPAKRRRVTAEMEGKYIIHMPKGTTPRTRKILEQQAAKGLQRRSVFQRLGSEAKGETSTGGKPTGVFSRLGDTLCPPGDKDDESDDDGSVLQYLGVLKKHPKPPGMGNVEPGGTIKAKATSSEAKSPTGVFSRLGDTLCPPGDKDDESDDDGSVLQYLGVLKKHPKPPGMGNVEPGGTIKAKATSSEAKSVPVTSATNPRIGHWGPRATRSHQAVVTTQDDGVSSTKERPEPEFRILSVRQDPEFQLRKEPEFRVRLNRSWGCGKVSSTSEPPPAQMDSAGSVSVFQRLGRKPD